MKEQIKNIIKNNKSIYVCYTKMFNKAYKNHLKHYKSGISAEIKDKYIQLREMELLKNYWGISPLHYYRYSLYLRRCELENEELLDYIPPYYFYNIYLRQNYGDLDTQKLSSKIYQHTLFLNAGIPTPQPLFFLINSKYTNHYNISLPNSEIPLLLKKSAARRIFIKPDNGKGGKGILIANKKSNGSYYDLHDKEITSSYMLKLSRSADWIVQEEVTQSPFLNKICSSSVNTVRIITKSNRSSVKLIAAALRVGRINSYVDNSAQGGISIGIDLCDGSLNTFAITELSPHYFNRHPDTGFEFSGEKIPNWNLVKSFILSAAQKLAFISDIGWDLVITNEGFSVIELNINYGIDHIQLACGGLRRQLEIINP